MHEIERYDSYGCARWQPQLDLDETEDDHEKIRQELLQLHETGTHSENILILMQKSYFLQRININNRTGDLKTVLLMWPFLYSSTHLLHHCNSLLGKDVKSVYQKVVENRSILIYRLMKSHILTKTTKKVQEMTNIVEQAEEAALNLQSNSPYLLASFLLVIHHFQEDTHSVLRVVDVSTLYFYLVLPGCHSFFLDVYFKMYFSHQLQKQPWKKLNQTGLF